MFRVVPTSVGMHPGLDGSFLRLRFPDRSGVVVVSCGNSSLFLEETEDIEHYKAVTVELFKVAMNHRESVALAASIAAALE